MTDSLANRDTTAEVAYPTGQYDRDRMQHQFTMVVGLILVVAGIGMGGLSAYMFGLGENPAGAVLVLFAALCLVLGLGAAIPDGQLFYLRVFGHFRGGLRDLSPFRKTVPERRAPESRLPVADDEPRPADPDERPDPEPDGEPPKDGTQTAERPVPKVETSPDQMLTGTDDRPVRLEERWRLANRSEVRLRNHIGPAYLLDETYHFLDWNPVFDDLIARDLNLHRGMHAQFFVNALANRDVVIPRAQQRFAEHGPPLVDLEPLVFDSNRFGRIEFQKIASRILDDHGDTLLWIVTLNISCVEEQHAADLWKDIHEKLVEAANWTAYAASYDNLLNNFDAYGELLDQIVSRVGDAKRCIDLGAGTGNTALKLLENPDRLVWAVEDNDGMLRCLDDKILVDGESGMADRLFMSKANIRSLGEFQRGFFDSATMMNVLYAVDDPLACLKEANRVLRTDGILVLSTSTDRTDVDKLFDAMRANLEAKNMFDDLRTSWADAKDVHERMDAKIHRDTAADVRAYLEKAGFEIDEGAWLDSAYADAVIVVKARKIREAF